MEKKFTLGIIGAGNMSSAILGGVLRGGLLRADRIAVSDRDPEKLAVMAQNGVYTTADNREVASLSEYLMFAVKPQVAPAVVMPNTPALVGEGMSVIAFEEGARSQFVADIFASIGKVAELDESKFDAVTSLSGSGPAYVYMFIEALIDGGVEGGLDPETAKLLAIQTVRGSAKMVAVSSRPVGELIDAVCSKGGTTIQAVDSFREDGLEDIVRRLGGDPVLQKIPQRSERRRARHHQQPHGAQSDHRRVETFEGAVHRHRLQRLGILRGSVFAGLGVGLAQERLAHGCERRGEERRPLAGTARRDETAQGDLRQGERARRQRA